MPTALIPLILEYAIKYGIPAVVSLIDVIKKPTMTWDEIQAAFKVAETPYGLTPQLLDPAAQAAALKAIEAACVGPDCERTSPATVKP